MAASKASTSTVSSHADSIFLENEHETPRKLPNSQSKNTNQSRGFTRTVENANPNPNPKIQEEGKDGRAHVLLYRLQFDAIKATVHP